MRWGWGGSGEVGGTCRGRGGGSGEVGVHVGGGGDQVRWGYMWGGPVHLT